jgi:hypothetical protein
MKLVNNIRRGLCAHDYSEFVDNFFSDLQQTGKISGLGLFGEFSDPGISDVDAIIIAKPGSCRTIFDYVQRWIHDRDLAQYLFMHPPVLMSDAMVSSASYLHTFYGIKWFCRENGSSFQIVPNSSSDYLNIAWISFLLPIAISFYIAPEVKLRAALHVLKNLHTSCENLNSMLGRKKKYRINSHAIRTRVLKAEEDDSSIIKAVQDEFRYTLQEIFQLIDELGSTYLSEYKPLNAFDKTFSLGYSVNIKPSERTAFDIHTRYASLLFNKKVMSWLLESRDFLTENDFPSLRYWKAFYDAANLSRKENIPIQFISPFGYPFADKSVKAFLRDNLLNIVCRYKEIVGKLPCY